MFGLSFLSPLFLVGAAAAAIPIALHLFYRRTEPVVEFAAMRYLRRSPVELTRRRRLRELLLLALRVASLVLLATAFARPHSASAAAAGAEATIVLVDASASVTAPNQFDRVRDRAQQAVRDAPAAHSVGVLRFAPDVEVISPISADRAGALAAVAAIEPGAGATRFQAALHRAGEELGGRSGRIVVVTDLQRSGWEAASAVGISEDVAVEVADVGGPDSNLAVTSLRVEDGEAVALVQRFPARASTESIAFDLDGRPLGTVRADVSAGGSGEARFRLAPGASGALRASVADTDGYAADNARFAVAGPEAAVSVVAVSAFADGGDVLYLERALRTIGGAGGFTFQSVSAQAWASLDAETLARVHVVVVAATRGLEQRGRERLADFVRMGGGVFVIAGPESDGAVIRQALGDGVGSRWSAPAAAAVSVASADGRHPVLRLFDAGGELGTIGFSRVVRIDAAPRTRVLARFTDGAPALLEPSAATGDGAGVWSGGGRVLVFASDLNNRWNDFPLQPSFVPFVHESVRYLAGTRQARTEYLVGELPGAAGSVPGVVSLPDSRGGSGRRAAINVDPRESDPRRMTADAFRDGLSRLEANAAQRAALDEQEREDRQGLWRYGILLMMAGVVLEGVLGRWV